MSRGLGDVYKRQHQYQLARTAEDGNQFVVLRKVDENGVSEVARNPISSGSDAIDLKVISDGKTYAFHYSLDRGASWSAIAENVDARHTSTAVAGGFTGTTVGPFAVKAKTGEALAAAAK